MQNYKIALAFIALLISASPTLAQEVAPKPVEISAQGSLEWDKNKKTYTAREAVIVKQDNIQIECDNLQASYADAKSVTDISQLEATGNVVISSASYRAIGDEAIYNVITGVATLTGDKIEVSTEKDVMTADDKIEFVKSENKLTAYGNPVIKHMDETIKAKIMTAYFKYDDQGKIIADRMEASGGIVIDTGKETVTGDKIVYDNQTRKAVLSGNVIVQKGNDKLVGSKAIVDMNTGISQLLGNSTGGEGKGRVTGTFFPKKSK